MATGTGGPTRAGLPTTHLPSLSLSLGRFNFCSCALWLVLPLGPLVFWPCHGYLHRGSRYAVARCAEIPSSSKPEAQIKEQQGKIARSHLCASSMRTSLHDENPSPLPCEAATSEAANNDMLHVCRTRVCCIQKEPVNLGVALDWGRDPGLIVWKRADGGA